MTNMTEIPISLPVTQPDNVKMFISDFPSSNWRQCYQ